VIVSLSQAALTSRDTGSRRRPGICQRAHPPHAAPAYNQAMASSLILRRSLGTFLLVATVGLTTCQGAFNASLPNATISAPALESKPAPATNHG